METAPHSCLVSEQSPGPEVGSVPAAGRTHSGASLWRPRLSGPRPTWVLINPFNTACGVPLADAASSSLRAPALLWDLALLAAALSLGRKGCWQLSPRAFPPRVPLQVRPQAAPESPMARLGHRAFLLLPRGPEAHWPCVLWMKPPFAVISPRAGPSTQVQEIEGCEMRKRLVGLP